MTSDHTTCDEMSFSVSDKLIELDHELTVFTAEAHFIIAKFKHSQLTQTEKHRGTEVKLTLRSLIVEKAALKALEELDKIEM